MKNEMETNEKAIVEGQLRKLVEVTLKMECELYALAKKSE